MLVSKMIQLKGKEHTWAHAITSPLTQGPSIIACYIAITCHIAIVESIICKYTVH